MISLPRLPLPEIGQIIDSPAELALREHYPVFVRREPGDDDQFEFELTALATTEAAALRNYDQSMGQLREQLGRLDDDWRAEEYGARAELLHRHLGYLGTPELRRGVRWMAEVVQARLRQNDEVFVAVSRDKSSSDIYSRLAEQTDVLDEDAQARIIPFDPSALRRRRASIRARQRMAAAGVYLIDDRLVWGSQATGTIAELRDYAGVDPDRVEVLVIAASTRHLREGLHGDTPCQSLYEDTRPGELRRRAALTSTTGEVDDGFRENLDELFANTRHALHMRHGARRPRLALPHLTRIERAYGPSPVPERDRQGDFTVFDQERARYKAVLGQLVDLATL